MVKQSQEYSNDNMHKGGYHIDFSKNKRKKYAAADLNYLRFDLLENLSRSFKS